jgi:hypothetical protein
VSIIYNALQKAQRNRQKATNTKVQMIRRLEYILLSIIILLAAYDYVPELIKYASSIRPATTITPLKVVEVAIAKPQPAPINQANYKNSHVLSGIYLSNEEKIAVINNKFFHLGDSIDGMKLVSIEDNRIVLRNADDALILQTEQL